MTVNFLFILLFQTMCCNANIIHNCHYQVLDYDIKLRRRRDLSDDPGSLSTTGSWRNMFNVRLNPFGLLKDEVGSVLKHVPFFGQKTTEEITTTTMMAPSFEPDYGNAQNDTNLGRDNISPEQEREAQQAKEEQELDEIKQVQQQEEKAIEQKADEKAKALASKYIQLILQKQKQQKLLQQKLQTPATTAATPAVVAVQPVPATHSPLAQDILLHYQVPAYAPQVVVQPPAEGIAIQSVIQPYTVPLQQRVTQLPVIVQEIRRPIIVQQPVYQPASLALSGPLLPPPPAQLLITSPIIYITQPQVYAQPYAYQVPDNLPPLLPPAPAPYVQPALHLPPLLAPPLPYYPRHRLYNNFLFRKK